MYHSSGIEYDDQLLVHFRFTWCARHAVHVIAFPGKRSRIKNKSNKRSLSLHKLKFDGTNSTSMTSLYECQVKLIQLLTSYTDSNGFLN